MTDETKALEARLLMGTQEPGFATRMKAFAALEAADARIESLEAALDDAGVEIAGLRNSLERVTQLYQVTHCHAAARAALASGATPPDDVD